MGDGVGEYPCWCPYCGQSISFLLDTTVAGQTYVEDCEVCCQPIEISFDVDVDGNVTRFAARRQDD